jgi:predicted amino acid racemase
MRIEVDCERIKRNAEAIVTMCSARRIEVAGVTKGCCGDPDVGRAMLAGGVSMLAESRLRHVRRLRDAGITAGIMLLRLPRLSEIDEVVSLTELSLNSEVDTVRALSRAAVAKGVIHRVVLMIEAGDRREGVLPDDALGVASEIVGLRGVELIGLGGNMSCIGGVKATRENTQLLVDVAERIERGLGIRFRVISGGHTGSLWLVAQNEIPERVNQLRVGEGILLGTDNSTWYPLPCPHKDAFTVVAEVIELTTKPSLPEGVPAAGDALGRRPQWIDLGPRRRAILAMGEQDLHVEALRPKRPGVTIVGASTDHTVVDVTDADPPVKLGDELEFTPLWAALATSMASQDVVKVVKPSSVARGK